MQIKVEMKYILLWYIIGKKKSEKRIEKVDRMKNKENERSKKFLSCLMIHITGDEKPFYRLCKWLQLIFPLMNINKTHK